MISFNPGFFITALSILMFATPLLTIAQTQAATNPTAAAEAPVVQSGAASPAATQTPESISMEESLALRDPFRKPNKYSDLSSDVAVPELERYALDQIKIVGIITGPKKPKVLVTTPNSKMFIVQENDKLGNHSGFIRKIRDRSIVVREKIVNVIGQEENADIELKYNQKQNADSSQGKTSGKQL